jgi:two-component system response regulator
MTDTEAVDILLVEDNPQDAELTTRALKKNNLANRLFTVEDGAEAHETTLIRPRWCCST